MDARRDRNSESTICSGVDFEGLSDADVEAYHRGITEDAGGKALSAPAQTRGPSPGAKPGQMPPPQIRRGPKLHSVVAVRRALARVVRELALGTCTPAAGRARIAGLSALAKVLELQVLEAGAHARGPARRRWPAVSTRTRAQRVAALEAAAEQGRSEEEAADLAADAARAEVERSP